MLKYKNNPIILLVSRMVSPFIMLFALYVIFHGHYSPGGGFQGGTLLAAALLSGGEFLNYRFLPLAGFTAAELRSLGILMVEIGVGLAVMAILVAIYDDLLEGYPHD